MVIMFGGLLESLAATPVILEHKPSAVEVMDKSILDYTRQNATLDRIRNTYIEGDPASTLCVEFYGDRKEDLPPRLKALEDDLRSRKLGYAYRSETDPASQAKIWSLRENSLGLSMAMKGDAKSISFVEDTAVAPEKLRDYIDRFLEIIHRHGTTAGIYAHASVGCLHVQAGDQSQDRGRDSEVRGHGPRGGGPGAGIRRLAFGRTRRWPHAQPVQPADVRSGALRGVPAGETHLRSRRNSESRQNCGRAADHFESAFRHGLPDAESADLVRLLGIRRNGRRGGNVQRHRRLPEETLGHHVPFLHGHARRGTCHAGPRQRAAAGDDGEPRGGGTRRSGRIRRARSVPAVPGLQSGMPDRRGHGALQERVPGGLLEAPRDAAAGARAGQYPPAFRLGQPVCSPVELDGCRAAHALDDGKAAGHRPQARPAGLETADLRAVARRQSATEFRGGHSGNAIQRYVPESLRSRDRHRDPGNSGEGRLPGQRGPARLLRTPVDFAGPAGRSPGAGRPSGGSAVPDRRTRREDPVLRSRVASPSSKTTRRRSCAANSSRKRGR